MELFEKDYKAAAIKELERSVRNIKEKDETSHLLEEMAIIESNIDFAERLSLISTMQATFYRHCVLKAQLDFEHMQKTETRDDIVDDFENPRERAIRYQKMDNYKARIAQERARIDSDKGASKPISHEIEEHMR